MSSDDSYDPEDDRKAKRDNSGNKAKRKWLKKRKSTGPAATKRQVVIKQQRRARGEIDRSGDYQRRSKRRRCGDIDRSDEIMRLTLRRNAGDVDRSDEVERLTSRRRAGDVDRSDEVERLTSRRRAGDVDRSDEIQHKTLRRRAGDIDRSDEVERLTSRRRRGEVSRLAELKNRKDSRAMERDVSSFSIWTACAPPSDEQLKAFEKDPYTAVAAFRLMAGIPADPRICSANLEFQVDEENIISRFSKFCGHGATIKICGACGIGDIMSNDESYKLPLSHTRIFFLLCDKDFLRSISDLRRQSMHLLEIDEQTYHLDPAAFDDIDKTVNI